MRSSRAGTQGHTLLEVILVTLIISIVLAITMPEFAKPLAAAHLNALAGQMAADIRAVQQRAISEESAAYFIKFYPYGERYEVRRTGYPTYLVLNKVALPNTADLVGTTFSADRLAFSAHGTPVQGGTVTLRDKRSGRFRYVIVTPVTGRVRVSDRPPENWEK
ncbi:MAG: GspH/FimT family pseudopilin [Desulfotomaculales bacterium]